MSNISRAALLGLVLIGAGAPLRAQDPGDPDWPCIQRKVEHLSIGVMWPLPLPEDVEPLPDDLEDIAAQLALRRVSEDRARELLGEVAADHPDFGPDDYGRLFQATFEHIDRQRARIVAGIDRYARNQHALAGEIDRLQTEMSRLEADPEPDFDRIDAIEAELDGRLRVFSDRAKSLTYVCESPVLLEQRAYALAQMMLKSAG
ncbi:hypothetical protein Rumeso_04309 [Rubellimicrobium mesophilum DSM 19309]|uniref:Uncharacterized protein n=1 Tax=Rubellimicrobium mesophilum DSM 19309 TaxID=442562 RepID=A0A017HIG9_9RHOB|nr:hypothetical protein [Rubellimicrobium mesophilum]EYD74110.1 hypothetical protein Rumeso_04309 [Rubellimicrobium mesophilum DSM 19309]